MKINYVCAGRSNIIEPSHLSTYTGDQQSLRRAYPSAQCRHSLRECTASPKTSLFADTIRELEPALDKEPHLWIYCVAAHARLKDLNPHDTKVRFLVILAQL